MNKVTAARHIWRVMAPLPVFWRLHQVGRSLLLPFRGVLEQLPPQSSSNPPPVMLDLGCGHGVLLALAKRDRPDLELIGLDLSDEKIAAARAIFAASGTPVRELAVRDIADFVKQSVDIITIVDVLYLVPAEHWEGILRKCYECLKPGGRLLLKEMDPSIRWKFAILNLEERLAVKVFRLTMGRKIFTFPTVAEIRHRMEAVGFTVATTPIDRGYFVPHVLLVGHKP